jgi:hypothetical protein
LDVRKLGVINLETLNFHQTGKNQNREFFTSWFEKKRWLTVSEKKFFVSYAFCKSNWTVTGIRSLKHLCEQVKKNMEPLQPVLKIV